MVITHLISKHQLPIKVFVLQTGQLHPETLQLLSQVQSWPGLQLEVFEPNPTSVVEFVSREGQDAMYKSMVLRKACCHIRKIEPLARALAGQLAWITGLRREQSDARAEVPDIDRSAQEADPTQALKFNPLADWSWGDVWHYIAAEQVPYNPLHDQFYPSIGCAPCTRAISLGEDFRAGRWWWEQESTKECGLHASN
jgi:phosphoadenosine phosphosulfate reductase